MGNKSVVKVGQILKTTQDAEYQAALSDTKRTVKAGTRLWVGADNFVHYQNGMIQPISDTDFEVKGYDAAGIAEWLWLFIRNHTCISEDVLSDYNETPESFKDQLEYALDELGF